MELVGKIKFIDSEKQVGSTFKKRDVVVTTDEQYPQHILVQFVQDKCEILNGFHVGQNVSVGINLRGREWINPKGETVYFNTIQGWRIVKQDTSQQSPEPQSQSAVDNYETRTSPQQFASASTTNEEEPDDLPF